jgi:hypothetical protein
MLSREDEVARMRGNAIMRPRSKMLAQDLITMLITGVGAEPARCRLGLLPFSLDKSQGYNRDCRPMLDAQHMFQSAAVHNAGEWYYSTS